MDEMQASHALRHLIEATYNPRYGRSELEERTQAFYFLSVFHPKLSLKKRLDLANDIARRIR